MTQQRTKQLSLRIKSAGAPTDDQLAKIREFTLADLPADSLYVRTFALAHNAIDRDDDAFDDSLLADFARTLPGKGLFIRHPSGWDGDSGPGEGRFFEAELQHMALDAARTLLRQPDLQWPPGITTATILMAGAYLVRTEGNKDLLAKIDAGIASDVSIGFTARRGENHRDEQGREMQSRSLTSPGEALEGSLVWLGAQPGARAIKGANRNHNEEPTVDKVDKSLYDAAITEKAAAEAATNEAKAALAEAKPSHDIVVGLRSALGDDAHLVDKADDMAALIKAGKTRRDALIDDIVAGERAAGLCGDDDESVAAAKAIYAGYPLDKLEASAKHWNDRAAKGGKVPPSQPNRQPEGDPNGGAKGAPAVVADVTI